MAPAVPTIRALRAIPCGVASGVALLVGCARGDAHGAEGAHNDALLSAGKFVVRSAARHRGDTLVVLDAPHGRHGAQLRVPGAPGTVGDLYTGGITVRPDGRVTFNLVCNCVVSRDAAGLARHDLLTYDGTYAPRALGGGRVELRQVDGPAVDTLERVR